MFKTCKKARAAFPTFLHLLSQHLDQTIQEILVLIYLSHRLFAYAKTKTQISFAVTAKLISTFVFATYLVQFLYYLNPKFQASGHLLWLYRPGYVGPGRKPGKPVFSEQGSFEIRLYQKHVSVASVAHSMGSRQISSRRNKGAYLIIFDDNSKDNFCQIFIKTYVVGAH